MVRNIFSKFLNRTIYGERSFYKRHVKRFIPKSVRNYLWALVEMQRSIRYQNLPILRELYEVKTQLRELQSLLSQRLKGEYVEFVDN